MSFRSKASRFAVTLAAMLLLLYVVAAAGHTHANGMHGSDCQVCHLVHSPVLQPGVQAAIAQPEFTSALALPAPYISFSDPILSSEASRAPPSA
jgi:hypothetical protein